MTTGIDVAGYQVNDYSTNGLGFVFVKATEGTTYTNPRHAAQIAHGRERGLVVGHYHFARPGSMSAQADYFLRQAGAKAGDVLAFDWEDEGVTGAQKDAWLKYVQAKAPDHRVILYCNRDFWLHRDTTSYAADGLWIADPSAPMGQPRVDYPWLIHQYSSAGGTDRNFTDLSVAELRAWASRTTTPTVQEDDMAITDADADKIAAAVAGYAHPKLDVDAKTKVRTDLRQHTVNAEENSDAAVVSLRTLTAKVDALTAKVGATSTIDYAKLAAALLAAVKEN